MGIEFIIYCFYWIFEKYKSFIFHGTIDAKGKSKPKWAECFLQKKDLKMNREKIGKTNHKAPRFKDYSDESLGWEERLSMKKNRKKRKSKRKDFEFKNEY